MKTFFMGVASVASGGAVLYAGFLVLLAAAVLGLSRWLEPWLAALIVGGAVLLVGVVMVLAGRRKLDLADLKPDRTMQSLKRDKDVLARRTS
jgi:xanthine/uracil permease